MRYTTANVEYARNKVREVEKQITEHRSSIEEMLSNERQTALALSQLYTMEQILTEMRRFQKFLEQDIERHGAGRQIRSNAKHKPLRALDARSSSGDVNILEFAEAVIHHCGKQAPTYCARKMVDMLERGDRKKLATWLAIRTATMTLLEQSET